VTIPIGIAIDPRAPLARPRRGHKRRLLQVASLNRVKDQSLLLRALAIVRQRADVHLDLVGEDTLGGELQRDAAALGLTDAVTFHGFVRHTELGRFYQSADLYVQSSRHEAAGVSVLEAAAHGLPVVGTEVGYVDDWTPHAAFGVPPGDAAALASAIAHLLDRPLEAHILADAARRLVIARDVDWTARELSVVYAWLARRLAVADSDSEHTQR
jgi:glycosyltransferase involved in cell wall biosynthesis